MSRPLRVLVIRIGAMGDVLHGMPAVAGLRLALPDAFIGWAIAPRWVPLLASATGEMPFVDRLHLVRTSEWKKNPFARQSLQGIAALRRELHAARYDLVVDLQGSIKSAVTGWLAGTNSFIGPATPREPAARWLYTRSVPVVAASVIQQACELLGGALGMPVQPVPVSLPFHAEAKRWAAAVAENPVILVPEAGWGAKEWGASNFTALASSLQAAGNTVLINQAPGTAFADEIAAASGALAVESTLPQMIALTRRAALVIGGDTGPVHLAAALGRPTLALFGPTDPARNGPFFPGANARVLRASASFTDYRRHHATEAGLKKVTVEQVLATSLAMLKAGDPLDSDELIAHSSGPVKEPNG